MQMAHALSLLKLAVIALVLLGVDPFRYLGTHTPAPFVWMLNNKVGTALAAGVAVCSRTSKVCRTSTPRVYQPPDPAW